MKFNRPTNPCVYQNCRKSTINMAVATCYEHICKVCLEHVGVVWCVAIDTESSTTAQYLACTQCVQSIEGKLLEGLTVKDVQRLRDAEHEYIGKRVMC